MASPDRFGEIGGWSGILGRLLRGDSLSVVEAEVVMGQILAGDATEAQISALVIALRAKGESVEEMTGFVRAMLECSEVVTLGVEAVDVVGTGGDRLGSFNVSTLASLIVAGAGATVCKHGNRAASSSVGTADVLEKLGVAIELGPLGVRRCVEEAGVGFCFAPRYHPAMRFAGPVRKQLGIPTVFNFLGPLANPARVDRQLVGVSDPTMAPKMAGVLRANGSVRTMVVFADDGLDELSVTSPSTIIETNDGNSRTWRLEPGKLGFKRATLDDLRGGDAARNADLIRAVLDGGKGAQRDIGVLNAAAAMVVAGHVPNVEAGIEAAVRALDDGKAAAALDGLVRVSTEALAEENSGSK